MSDSSFPSNISSPSSEIENYVLSSSPLYEDPDTDWLDEDESDFEGEHAENGQWFFGNNPSNQYRHHSDESELEEYEPDDGNSDVSPYPSSLEFDEHSAEEIPLLDSLRSYMSEQEIDDDADGDESLDDHLSGEGIGQAQRNRRASTASESAEDIVQQEDHINDLIERESRYHQSFLRDSETVRGRLTEVNREIRSFGEIPALVEKYCRGLSNAFSIWTSCGYWLYQRSTDKVRFYYASSNTAIIDDSGQQLLIREMR